MTNLEKAIALHKTGNFSEAENLYRALLKQEPERADILHLLGIVLAQQKHYQEAVSYLRQAIDIEPTSAAYQNSLANTYKYLAQFNNAIAHYKIALTIDPTYAIAYNNAANSYLELKEETLALKNYQLALQYNPNYADAHFNLGRLYAQQNNLKEAETHFRQALKLDSNHANAHSQLANLLQKEQHYAEAIIEYQKSLALRPHHAETQHDLATALLQLNKYEEAIEHLKLALSLNPKYSEALHNLASTYVLIHRPDEALQHYLRLLEIAPEKETYYNIGVMLMYKDRHKEAINYFEHALAIDSHYLETHINLGATYLKQQDYAQAAKHYKIAHELQPNNEEIIYILNALTQENTPKAAPDRYLQNLFDQYAPYFEKHLLEHLDYQVPTKIHYAVIDAVNNNQLYKIVDLGCGTGLCGQLLKPLANELIGIDISQQMLDIASNKNVYTQLILANIETALTEINNVDILVAADVFTYIGDLTTVFAAARKAVKSNGLFIFTIEKTYVTDYELQKTARFAHNKKYIEHLATECDFQIKRFDNTTLRKQGKQWIEGYLIVLQQAASIISII